MRKTYLGDAVYADFDGWHIVLTTEDGMVNPTNIIYLEPGVVASLARFIKEVHKEIEQEEPKP